MRPSGGYLLKFFAVLACLSFFLALPGGVLAEEIRYEGIYTAAPNGDVAGVYKFTPPMAVYQQLRNSISNLYLLLRILAPARAEIEVKDKKADWDDSSSTLTFSFKTLGLARNLGNHWEIPVMPGVEFSNSNESTKTVYFNEDSGGPLGKIHGMSRLNLPPQARDISWDGSRRVVRYVMPIPETAAGGSSFALVAGLLLLAIGAVLTGASFLRRRVSLVITEDTEANEPKLIKHDKD